VDGDLKFAEPDKPGPLPTRERNVNFCGGVRAMAEGRLLLRVEDYTKRTEVGVACVLQPFSIVRGKPKINIESVGIAEKDPRSSPRYICTNS